MGVRMRTCPDCCRRVRFGASKSRCWACRQKRKPTAATGKVTSRKTSTRRWSGEYKERNELVATLGHKDYAAYLRSPVWAGISSTVLAARGSCELCHRSAAVVHHNRYTRENLTGETADHLHALCHPCHRRIEHGRTGEKLDLPAVRARFTRLLKRFRPLPPRKAGG